MWRFEPKEVTVPAGSTLDIYLSTTDVTHGLLLVGTDLNLMAVPGVVNYALSFMATGIFSCAFIEASYLSILASKKSF